MLFGYVREIKWGWLGVVCSSRGIVAACLPRKTAAEARSTLKQWFDACRVIFDSQPKGCDSYLDSLEEYFKGGVIKTKPRLDLEGTSDFDRAVWRKTRIVPYGETRSYGWVAEKLGRKGMARAVGGSLGRNRIPIFIPCHRIIRSDGALGGFGAGLEWKRRLLGLEAKHKP